MFNKLVKERHVIGSFSDVTSLPYEDDWGQENIAFVPVVATWSYELNNLDFSQTKIVVYLRVTLPNSKEVFLYDVSRYWTFNSVYEKAIKQAWASVSKRKLGRKINSGFYYTGRQLGDRNGIGYSRHLGGKSK